MEEEGGVGGRSGAGVPHLRGKIDFNDFICCGMGGGWGSRDVSSARRTKQTKKTLELTAATRQNINKLMFSGVWNGGVGGWSTPFLPHPKI